MDKFLMFTYFWKFPYGWRGLKEGMQDGKEIPVFVFALLSRKILVL